MKPIAIALFATLLTFAVVAVSTVETASAGGEESSPKSAGDAPSTAAAVVELPARKEARGRAVLLHETIAAVLEVVHHRYYREDEGLPIPAATLKDVFRELADRRNVEFRWLAVDAKAMNVEHEPRNEFEKEAVRAITAGAEDFESVDGGVYRRVGTITLQSECLKCHLPNRTSTQPRTAGLIVSMPLKRE